MDMFFANGLLPIYISSAAEMLRVWRNVSWMLTFSELMPRSNSTDPRFGRLLHLNVFADSRAGNEIVLRVVRLFK